MMNCWRVDELMEMAWVNEMRVQWTEK
jgi:hypothetical protein